MNIQKNIRENLAHIILCTSTAVFPLAQGCRTVQESLQTEQNPRGYVVVEQYRDPANAAFGLGVSVDIARLMDYVRGGEKKEGSRLSPSSKMIGAESTYPFFSRRMSTKER